MSQIVQAPWVLDVLIIQHHHQVDRLNGPERAYVHCKMFTGDHPLHLWPY
jgi:hypothetical protein